jgi:hypothetical protein
LGNSLKQFSVSLPKKSCTGVTVERYGTASGSERDQDATFHARIPSSPNDDSLTRSLPLAVLYRRQLMIDFLGKAVSGVSSGFDSPR